MRRFPLQRRTLAILFITLILLITVVIVRGQAQASQAGSPQALATHQNGNDEGPLLASTVSLPVVVKEGAPGPVTPMGVQMYGNTLANNPLLPSLLESRASWLRIPVRWDTAQPTEGSGIIWSGIDSSLAVAGMGGPQLIGTIDLAPTWAAEFQGSPIYPDKVDDFADFVAAVVERYDGDGVEDAPGSPIVLYWELYNEPDRRFSNITASRPGWGNDGDRYAQMLAAVYPAVKAANPAARVVMGGIAYDWFEDQNGPFVRAFIDDVLKSGGGAHFDIMNFHAYPSFSTNWTSNGGPGLREKAIALRAKLASYGVQKPFIMTEAGWHSNNTPAYPSTPEIQARYVVELFVQAMAGDVDVMIWWRLDDPTGDYGMMNGLVTSDSPPAKKPSFSAYVTLINELGTAQFVEKLGIGQTGSDLVEAYRFNDNANGKTVYVAWHNPVETGTTRPLKLAGSVATVRDIYGSAYTLIDGADGIVDGQVTVTVAGQPIYVEIAQ